VVTDGFTGNVAVKTMEGAAKMLSIYMRNEFSKTWLNRLLGIPALPVLRGFRANLDPRQYNGASLVGLRDIVIKSHGGADALAFEVALNTAVLEVQKSVPKKIAKLLDQQLNTQVE
ncbi:MAG: phosphate acyltransferase, partial [Pseudomonadota bacterium]